jgi:hypothetical protein
MKKTLTIIGLAVATLAGLNAQTSFTSNSVSGTFSTITGTDLGGGLSWDTSALYTTGVITVVPEPKTWALIALGSAFMLWNLRRKRSIKA